MKSICILLLCFLLSACAAQWHRSEDVDGQRRYNLHFQRNNTAAPAGVVPIQAADLQAGDILFSADSGLQSRSLRLFGNSSVSHTFLYLGDGQIAEAVGSGVHIGSLDDSVRHSPLLAVYRHPQFSSTEAAAIRRFAEQEAGGKYNYVGILKQTPYTVTRKVCELPLIPRQFRHMCLNTMALVQVTPFSSERYFCSQLVIEAYNRAGLPLTHTPPEWISPADILHMREHDVPSVVPVVPLQYVGHLRCRASLWNGACTEAARVGNSAAAAPLAADALPPADFSDEVR